MNLSKKFEELTISCCAICKTQFEYKESYKPTCSFSRKYLDTLCCKKCNRKLRKGIKIPKSSSM